MTAEIVQIGAANRLLRGEAAEEARLRTIAVRRQAAFRRALDLEYSPADQAMFGPMDNLLREGCGPDPRLTGPGATP